MAYPPHTTLSTALIHFLLTVAGNAVVLWNMGSTDSSEKILGVAAAGAALLLAPILIARSWWDVVHREEHGKFLDTRTRRLLLALAFSSVGLSVALGALELTLNSNIQFSSLTWVPQLTLAIYGVQLSILLVLRPIAAGFSTTINSHTLGEYFLAPLAATTQMPIGIRHDSPRVKTESTEAVVAQLQGRVSSLRIANAMLLFLIIGIISATAIFIVFAGSVATRDTLSLDRIATQRKVIDTLEGLLQQVEAEKEEIQSKIATDKLLIENNRISEDRKAAAKNRIAESVAKLDAVSAKLDRRASDYKQARQALERSEESSAEGHDGPDKQATATNLLLAAGITRFGVLALAIYLVQILLNLYRFNAEVATQYLSQADSIQLVEQDGERLQVMLNVLKLDVQLAKAPAPLSKRALDQLVNALGTLSIGKNTSKDPKGAGADA